jgi:hypothetical protein
LHCSGQIAAEITFSWHLSKTCGVTRADAENAAALDNRRLLVSVGPAAHRSSTA